MNNFYVVFGKDKKIQPFYDIIRPLYHESYNVHKFEYIPNTDNLTSFLFMFLVPIFQVKIRTFVTNDLSFTYALNDNELLKKTENICDFYEKKFFEREQKKKEKEEKIKVINEKINELKSCN